ncbi:MULTISPECIES: glycosyltransferase family 1 protein [Cyanobium]|uniref:Glycosyltransferase family 1 protein n=1 Tax=Cyanobium usitatum str. Tous TaxID=2116684 RepID=A0A2P7MQF1_9CYAN|nr:MULTISPECIES: glycosyltransferase family 1 protein [Cyanobium]MCP9779108.1 glycosyltransferase family 4 protein [Cyanobium sp. To12R1]PSJ03440.1 hypothetical protein C7K55_13050 [Cyanobium usitatum str. Tous]
MFVLNALNYVPLHTGLSRYTERVVAGLSKKLIFKILAISPERFEPNLFNHGLPSSYTSKRSSYFASKALTQYFLDYRHLLFSSKAELIYSPLPDYLVGCNNCKQIITCHDLTPLFYPNSFTAYIYARHLLAHYCNKAGKVIAISKFVADQLIECFNISASKIEIIYNGVETQSIAKPALPGRDIVVIARHDHNKNLKLAIAGFNIFVKQATYWSGSLILVGKPGKETKNLQLLAKELEVDSRIRWISNVSSGHLFDIVSSSLCLLSASLMEGCDYPLLEAQSLGVPTLASDIPVHREMHTDVAILFDLNDGGISLAKALLALTESPALWQQLSLAGMANACKFSISNQVDLIAKEIQSS